MSHIQIVNTNDGIGKSLEENLGISTVATSTESLSFEPTDIRGGIAIKSDSLPTDPTPGTISIDSNDGNTLKWWNGTIWKSAGQ
jgi:hypothetical protein